MCDNYYTELDYSKIKINKDFRLINLVSARTSCRLKNVFQFVDVPISELTTTANLMD